MRDTEGRNRARAQEPLDAAQGDRTDIRVVELDVRLQKSADTKVETVPAGDVRLDVVSAARTSWRCRSPHVSFPPPHTEWKVQEN